MNKIYCLILAIFGLIATSCDSKLDIVPHGITTFTDIDELETLINQQWRIYDWDLNYNVLCNQTYPYWTDLEELYNVTNSIEHAIYFCDETVDRADLTEDDGRYSDLYKHINYMNIILSKVDEVSGDASRKKTLAAEAKVLRAWFHFLLVNFYAAQYDDATAEKTGGIPYVDNTDSSIQKTKQSVAEVYRHILNDCSDEVISNLKTKLTNDPCRFEVDFGYAVRARVLFQMKHYDDAAAYARKALALNSSVENRKSILTSGTWLKAFNADDVYLFINSNSVVNSCTLSMHPLTEEYVSLFEEGDYLRDHSPEDEWLEYDDLGFGYPGISLYYGSSARVNVFGIDAEQMYYVVGESLIMQGDIDGGLEMVDRVRANRIDEENFAPFKGTVSNKKEALALLRNAKRVEFPLNYEYFFDCKRLNSDPETAFTIIRDCGEYGTRELRPDSPLWIYPFPMNAVNYNSSLTQNYLDN
ncbi:MAG: RagB/SusD family nutrient uptake outer membrane protein [Muribaculaceae bacterium]|nr:RagB/SusD family nutrient uptake outer membrane protein [Muribaculaceae bacterium]